VPVQKKPASQIRSTALPHSGEAERTLRGGHFFTAGDEMEAEALAEIGSSLYMNW